MKVTDENSLKPEIDQANIVKTRNKFFLLIPLTFVIFAGVLAWQLLTGTPDKIPSALIDKAVPEFNLGPIPSLETGLSSDDIISGGPSIVNVFSSWCGPCRVEHPLLMEVAKQKLLPIWGINYKDQPNDAINWLDKLGNPYTKIGSDLDGKVGIEWGVYGVPETFVIDSNGRIIYKHIGILTKQDLKEKVIPLVQSLSK